MTIVLTIGVLLFLPPLLRGGILKGPYLQNVGTDRITVMWETETATDSRVDYGPTDSYGSFTEGTAFLSHCGRYIHEVVLEGLAVESLYYYRVESGGFQSSGYTFRTAPEADSLFNFILYGDNRSNYGDHVTQHGEIVASILEDGPLPDLIVISGDVVENGDRCVDIPGISGWGPEYFTPGQPLFGRLPQFVAIGNHEYYNVGPGLTDPPVNYQDYFDFPPNGSPNPDYDELWYSFTYGNAQFFMINSNYYFQTTGDFSPGSPQYEWLTDELEKSDAVWKFASFHHPPYCRYHSFEENDTRSPARVYLVPLFERYGVQAILNGHFHFYERSRKRGLNYVTAGGGGGPLSPVEDPEFNPYSIYADSLFHYCRFEIDGPRLSYFALDTDGVAFDSFELDLEDDGDLDGYLDGDEFSSAWDPTDPYSPAPLSVASGDYNGDGTDEIAIFRPESGLWAVRGLTRCYFGEDGDRPVSADYNGDGTDEIAIFRLETGLWAIRGITRLYFGTSPAGVRPPAPSTSASESAPYTGDLPVPADYDGDGGCELGIFRPENGLWVVRGLTRFHFGSEGDHPLPADYNGDGSADGAVFRMGEGLWAVRDLTRFYFGTGGDLPFVVDSEALIFRSRSGVWRRRGIGSYHFGAYGDHPVPADYDGDGEEEIGVFRPENGLWAVRGVTRVYYGATGDVPVTR